MSLKQATRQVAGKRGANDQCWCGSGNKYKRCHKAVDDARRNRRVQPGVLSPTRTVPEGTPLPPYLLNNRRGRPADGRSFERHDAEGLVKMRAACAAAAEILAAAGRLVAPGVTTDDIDVFVHQACLDRGGYPSPLGYASGGTTQYPKSVCTSVNEVICHGIPDDRPLEDGDIVDIDVTIYLDGYHGDTNATFLVGEVDESSRNLVRVTRECMEKGIGTVRPGSSVWEIGRAIQDHAHAHGLSVVRAFVGHGVGKQFHGAPTIFHYPEPRAKAVVLEAGMTFTVEPMIAVGTGAHVMWADDWTAVTADGKRSAQFEHTILVTDDGAEILTVPTDGPVYGGLA